MIETFTTQIIPSITNQDEKIIGRLSDEDEVYYAQLKGSLNELLKQPSTLSVDTILTYARQASSSSL